MSALHARPGRDLGLPALGTQLSHRPTRIVLSVKAQHDQRKWQLRFARCTAVFRQLAAARQSQGQDIRSSLCIGVGAGALAYNGGSGPNGPSSGGGGSGGSGGDGWHAGPGHNSVSNVLSDVAAVNEASSEAAEQVILLDVGGRVPGLPSGYHVQHGMATLYSGAAANAWLMVQHPAAAVVKSH